MSIQLESLTPAHSATGVLLASSVSFTLVSTDNLNLASLIFTINTVQVTPTITVNVAGPLSITCTFPLSDAWYGQYYVGNVVISSVSSTLNQSFSFTTEQGVFLNSNPSTYAYSQSTQELANYLPEEMKGRYDKYSTYQQLLNVNGVLVESCDLYLTQQLGAYYIQTTSMADLANMFQVSLPSTFSFTSLLQNDGSLLFEPPPILGFIDYTQFMVGSTYENNLFSFYYNALPTRLTLAEEPAFGSTTILSTTPITYGVTQLDLELARPGGFVILTSGGSNWTSVDEQLNIMVVTCRLVGTSLFDQVQTEEFTLIDNSPYYTKKNWNTISSVQFYNLPLAFTGNFEIDYFQGQNALVQDVRNYTGVYNSAPLSWQLDWDDTNTNRTFLQTLTSIGDTPLEVLRNSSIEVLREFELFDVDNLTNVKMVDLTSQPLDNWIYFIDEHYLYIYNKEEEYPTGLRNLRNVTQDPLVVISLEADELRYATVGGKTVSLSAVQQYLSKKVTGYRFRVLKPDFTTAYILLNGTETQNSNLAWNYISVTTSNFLSPEIDYNTTQDGDYYFYLDIQYSDGSTDTDGKIMRTLTKSALAKYKLAQWLGTNTAVRLFFDTDQLLKLIDNAGNLYTITFNRDNMLIDYTNMIVYLNENYDNVILNDGLS